MTHPLILSLAGIAVLLALFWFADLFLLLFAAILIAAILDAAIGLMRKIVPGPRGVSLGLTLVVTVALLGLGAFVGGMTIIDQIEALVDILAEGWDVVAGILNGWGIPVLRTFNAEDILERLPEPQTMFGGVGAVLGTGLGLVSNLVIVFLVAVFLAADPARYRDGLALLVPLTYRQRIASVFDRAGITLQRWLVGQLALMVIVGGLTTFWLMIMGVDYALSLGLLAGLLNFIPFLGPILAFIPLGLAMLGQEPATALIVLGGYLAIQQLDANVLSPLIQDRVVNLAPALSIGFLLFMGVVQGPIGVALATPLLAALRVLVLEIYVADMLGDRTVSKTDDRA